MAREPDPMTRPQQSWASVYDEHGGLAVIAPGLMEVMVADLPRRPIALTLFRSTGHTVLTDGEPDGQLRGVLRFKYYVSPVINSPNRVSLSQLGQRSIAGLRQVQFMKNDLDKLGLTDRLPPILEFINIEGHVIVTGIRQVNAALEIRLFNPNVQPESATIELLKDNPLLPTPRYAQRVNFEHQPLGEKQELEQRTLSLTIDPKKIVTIRFS
jgi:alpha-mannosidase/mannosylglycerate hydrolase